jgi:alanine racemase
MWPLPFKPQENPMTAATLTIDLDAVHGNWRALDALTDGNVETAAVVKADGYGLSASRVSAALSRAGVSSFFVAEAGEAIAVRKAVGDAPDIYVFSGHMAGDTEVLRCHNLIPLLNCAAQVARHFSVSPALPFGFQLDTGMNRLGMEAGEFAILRDQLLAATPRLAISHLACADTPDHPMNAAQLATFQKMTDGLGLRRSLAATGGILLGAAYHFDLTRPGVGLYGGQPFDEARSVVHLSIPVIQTRHVETGETVGYAGGWTAARPSHVATLAAGYADGLIRAMGDNARVWANGVGCPVIGRVSMDMLAVDVTDLDTVPQAFDILGPDQGVDDLAAAAGTIGYEILTSLGARYKRVYKGGK